MMVDGKGNRYGVADNVRVTYVEAANRDPKRMGCAGIASASSRTGESDER